LTQNQNDAEHWHDRAGKMRALSEQMGDPRAKVLLLDLASDYDKIAAGGIWAPAPALTPITE
jgi:hypothetical protein